MTAARCSLGMAAERARRAPRNATPKPAPPMIAPVRKTTLESVEAAMTISTMPEESATDPAAAPAQGGVRPRTIWATAAEPASAKTGIPATRWLVVWKRSAESCGPSDRNRPPIDQDEMTPRAASRKGRRTADGALGDRLGHPPDALEGDREEHEQRYVGKHARGGQELDEGSRDEHAEAQAPGAHDAVGQPDAGGVAPWVQIEQSGARRAERGAGGQPLHAAGDEEPHDRVRQHEEHGGAHQGGKGGEQHGEHAESVGRVDEREDERREPPQLTVDAVERRRRAGREEGQADDRAGQRVGHGRGERAGRGG